MQITFAAENLAKTRNIVVGVFEDGALSAQASQLNDLLDGFIKKAMKNADFKGKKGKFLALHAPDKLDVIVLAGLGKADEFELLDAQKLGGSIVAELNTLRLKEAGIALGNNKLLLNGIDLAAQVAFGATLRSYRFDKYKTKQKDDKKPSLKTLTILQDNPKEVQSFYETLEAIADGVFLTRDLVNEPANVLNPDTFPKYCKELIPLGVDVQILGEKEMQKLGMNALLGVGQGSAFESKLIIMEWKGGTKKQQPVAFVGKGVCFDTGGISIKPANNMEEMKWDMGGAGVVTGLMKTLASRKAKVNAIGVIGVVENMPSGTAQRPGDVVTSMSGQTIEVINTDAEGRLVLADALWYTQDKYKPQFMVDLATLTGAIIVSLADQYGGLFSNNDTLSNRLVEAGETVGEPLWRMPLGKAFDEMIDCDIADMRNIGDGRGAGSTTAAQFLQRFVNDVPWAHLDIAGVAWSKKDAPTTPKGATAYGVRLLDTLVQKFYETE